MSISEIAVKRPLLIVVIFTILVLFGIQCYLSLNYNLLPNIQVNTVSVTTVYPGASASEVENSVTKKLEDAFASLEGLDIINATSQEGVSQISINLKSSADIDKAERDVQRKADQASSELPITADKPLVSKVNLEETPVLQAGASSSLSPKELYDLIDKQIKPVLQNVAGVGQVNILGGAQREIQVNIDEARLRNFKLGIGNISSAISNANRSFPAGALETDRQQFSIRFDANVADLAELNNIIVSRTGNSIVYLKDVAEVVDASAKTTAINHINGVPSVGIQIVKQSDANAVNLSSAVKQAFSQLEGQYKAQQLRFTVTNDQSLYTLEAADAVIFDLGLAILIVGVVMLAFLHSVRSSLFVLVALPCSIIPTFIMMYLAGFSLNLMTLMALSLVVGILVDDSIVVLENIYRHLEMGSDKRKAALDGRSEIGFTALAITLVDVVVFLPLALSGGLIGSILREFSLVVVFSTLMSLFVSFTVTPLLASRWGRLEHLTRNSWWGRINLAFEGLIEHIKADYGMLLAYLLRRKRWLFTGVILMLVGSVMLVAKGFIGGAFIPAGDKGELVLKLEMSPSSSIYQTNMVAQQAESILLRQPQVKQVFSSVGFVTGSTAGAGNNSNQAELTITLVDAKDRDVTAEEFGAYIQELLTKEIAGIKIAAVATSISGGSAQSPVQVAVKGTNLKDVRATAEQVQKVISSIPGTQSVELSVKDQKKEVAIRLDREKMALLGLDANQVGLAMQQAYSGDDDSKFRQNGEEYDIRVQLSSRNKSDINDVKKLTFTNKDGRSFQLGQFARVGMVLGESVLQRSNRLSAITVKANVVGRSVGTVNSEIREQAQKLRIPQGVSINYEGDAKNQGEAFGSLGIALVTAILLVYFVMVALYESLVYPFVVLFSIPVAIIGALLALALSMETLNIFSIIGMIMLLGLVSKNAILIVDFTNHLKAQGSRVTEALVEAGKERLRPILMTTLAMIFGMLPIALASGAGAEIKNGMAWTIIGGLTSSMVLTLFVVPAMYLVVDRLKSRFTKPGRAGHQLIKEQPV